MKVTRVIIVSLILAMVVGLGSCAGPAPSSVPRVTPVPMPTPSVTVAQIAELEAKIRQLEAENQRLLTENRELGDNLAEVTSQLEGIQNLVTSSDYTQTLSKLPKIQNDASDLATFLSSLPDLPPPPPGLTVAKIDDAINKVRHLRDILKKLPPPPPFAPPFWTDLDRMKQQFIDMTVWVEDLEDLPEFLRVAGGLDDLRSDMIVYLRDIEAILSDVKATLEEVRNTAGPQ